jgi:FMN-dependent NADH-azoreductase
MKLLHVDSSILAGGSVSRSLSADIVASLTARNPGLEITTLDLATNPIGHLTGAHLAAAQGARAEAPGLAGDIAAGAKALEDFLAADIVVVGAPMYNFTIPSQLKAWIDRLAIAGKSFRYTASGPEGLAGGKKVIVASSRGGFYRPEAPTHMLDHQESYLRAIFGFFGITDISFVRAEGVAMGAEQRASALESAKADITRLAA